MASRVRFLPEECPELPEHPYQPTDFTFPRRSFGKSKLVTKRSFQSAWFKQWQWLHYDAAQDLAFFFVCLNAIKAGRPVNNSLLIVNSYI